MLIHLVDVGLALDLGSQLVLGKALDARDWASMGEDFSLRSRHLHGGSAVGWPVCSPCRPS